LKITNLIQNEKLAQEGLTVCKSNLNIFNEKLYNIQE